MKHEEMPMTWSAAYSPLVRDPQPRLDNNDKMTGFKTSPIYTFSSYDS